MAPSPMPVTSPIDQIMDALANIGKCSAAIRDLLPTLVDSVSTAPANDTSSSADTTYDGDISLIQSEGSTITDICQCAAHSPPKSAEPFIYFKETLKKEKIVARSGFEEVDCRACGKTVQARNLEEHMNTHLMYKERPFKCNLCPKRYSYKKDLKRHMRAHHPAYVY